MIVSRVFREANKCAIFLKLYLMRIQLTNDNFSYNSCPIFVKALLDEDLKGVILFGLCQYSFIFFWALDLLEIRGGIRTYQLTGAYDIDYTCPS